MDRRKILYPRDYINTLNSKQRNCLEVLAIGSIIVPSSAQAGLFEGRFFDENFAICQNFTIFDS